MDAKLLIGVGLILWAWSQRNGWPSFSASPGVVTQTPASTATTGTQPVSTTPATTPVLNIGGASALVNDPVQLGAPATSFDPAAYANAFANAVDLIPIGDTGAGTAGRDPRYAPGVVDVGGGGAVVDSGPVNNVPVNTDLGIGIDGGGGTVDPSTLDWLNGAYGGGDAAWNDVQDWLEYGEMQTA